MLAASSEEPVPAPALEPSRTAPSLAVVQGRWQAVLDGYVGNLLDKIMLARLHPAALQDGVLTLGGRLDALELRKIESCRKGLETRLVGVFDFPLRVRFAGDDSRPPEPVEPSVGGVTASAASPMLTASPPAPMLMAAPSGPVTAAPSEEFGGSSEPEWHDDVPTPDEYFPSDDEAELSLAETAARLFGGEIVADAPESGRKSRPASVPYDDHGP
jgi:hypothetical protein